MVPTRRDTAGVGGANQVRVAPGPARRHATVEKSATCSSPLAYETILNLQRSAGNSAVSRLLAGPAVPVVQRKWAAQQDVSGLIYYHHYITGARDPNDREYKNIPNTMAFVDDQDFRWSELRDERLQARNDLANWKWRNTPMGAKAIGQSTKKFNFSMRLAKVRPGGEVVASSQKLLNLILASHGITGKKIKKTAFKKHKLATAVGVIKGRTFMYRPGGTRPRKAKAVAKKAAAKLKLALLRLPLGKASASPKKASITLSGPAAKGGRTPTKTAFNGVSAAMHADAHNGVLPKQVQPAKSRRWEWLHLVGDAIGGPTSAVNLAAGTFDSNSRHNAIEEAVVKASQAATPTNQLTYEVEAKLIPGTEIATEFNCRAKMPTINGGIWWVWAPVDTLTVSKEDKAEDALLRHASTLKS